MGHAGPAAQVTVGERRRTSAVPASPALLQQLHAAARTRFHGSSTAYLSAGQQQLAAAVRANGGARVQAR